MNCTILRAYDDLKLGTDMSNIGTMIHINISYFTQTYRTSKEIYWPNTTRLEESHKNVNLIPHLLQHQYPRPQSPDLHPPTEDLYTQYNSCPIRRSYYHRSHTTPETRDNSPHQAHQ
jgi:hypothetical protein